MKIEIKNAIIGAILTFLVTAILKYSFLFFFGDDGKIELISNKLNDSELQALDRKLNDLIKRVKPDYTPKANPVYNPPATPKKPKKAKRADSASNLVKLYKKATEDYINSIPKELMQHEAINNYFTKGEYLINSMRMYDLYTKGVELHNFNTVKEFKKYFGTTSQKKLERMLKDLIVHLI